MSFVCVFKTSPRYLKKNVYSVTCPRRLKNISLKYLWLFKNTLRKWFRVISVALLKYLMK